jgi:hypothetical protein
MDVMTNGTNAGAEQEGRLGRAVVDRRRLDRPLGQTLTAAAETARIMATRKPHEERQG